MILITSIICMALVYYFLDSGLALGFITALFIEIFFLIGLYNILKNTEQRVKRTYERIINDYREKEAKSQKYIAMLKKKYPEIDSSEENSDGSEEKPKEDAAETDSQSQKDDAENKS